MKRGMKKPKTCNTADLAHNLERNGGGYTDSWGPLEAPLTLIAVRTIARGKESKYLQSGELLMLFVPQLTSVAGGS